MKKHFLNFALWIIKKYDSELSKNIQKLQWYSIREIRKSGTISDQEIISRHPESLAVEVQSNLLGKVAQTIVDMGGIQIERSDDIWGKGRHYGARCIVLIPKIKR